MAYPSVSIFRRRVRVVRQLAKTMERILTRESKLNRTRERERERERAQMPDSSGFITRILKVAEAEGFHVVRRLAS